MQKWSFFMSHMWKKFNFHVINSSAMKKVLFYEIYF